jgi:glycosidase
MLQTTHRQRPRVPFAGRVRFSFCSAILLTLLSAAFPLTARELASSVQHPEWSRNLSIYEVNVRQYTPGGTFKEFVEELPRLKELGVGILWLMPINPIGAKNRKGTLGSYYSVIDYRAVNPEFGTLDDFKSLVKRVHELGMYVIIDWVANHTAWDNLLTKEHPEWYLKDSAGAFAPPVPDWKDVIDLDYSQPGLRQYMIGAMKYWVTETGIDGFRCDVSGMVPMEFWDSARTELEKVKPIFMLAEDEQPQCHAAAFDMTYGWGLYHLMIDVAAGKKTASDIVRYFKKDARNYPGEAYRMYFTSNHDENSWNGTEFERFGDGYAAFAVLCATAKGMPLVYSGQEAELHRRLKFFDKDSISWRATRMDTVYRTLFDLKKANKALWNGIEGGGMTFLQTSRNHEILAFVREKSDQRVLVILNLSGKEQSFSLKSGEAAGEYSDVFSGRHVTVAKDYKTNLPRWGYQVLKSFKDR